MDHTRSGIFKEGPHHADFFRAFEIPHDDRQLDRCIVILHIKGTDLYVQQGRKTVAAVGVTAGFVGLHEGEPPGLPAAVVSKTCCIGGTPVRWRDRW